jgi:hypothetical protein
MTAVRPSEGLLSFMFFTESLLVAASATIFVDIANELMDWKEVGRDKDREDWESADRFYDLHESSSSQPVHSRGRYQCK